MTTLPYNLDYYSDKHVAYVDGYTLETRRVKYLDVIDNIREYLNQPLLDIGCGPGYLVHLLRENAFQAYGCDFSNAALQLVPETSKWYIQRADVRELPYKASQFASSTAFHVLEHLEENDVEKAIRELFRVTRERFYGFVPTIDGIAQKDAVIRNQILNDPTHLTMRKRNWWLEKFEKEGWKENKQLEEKFDKKRYGWVFVMDK